MIEFEIQLSKKSEKDLTRLNPKVRKRILAKILVLKINRFPQQYKHLVNHNMAKYRLRVGDYRIVYDVFDSEGVVLIYRIGHRKDIYR